jgi:amidase
MPAARAEVYALKISPGTVDDTGVQPASRPLDCLCGFTRSVTDLAHLVALMQGKKPDHYLPLPSSWDGLKVGFVDPKLWRSYPAAIEPIDGFFEQTDAAMVAAGEKIIKLGGKVVHSVPVLS